MPAGEHRVAIRYGFLPADAIVDFTYTVLTATARTVAFSSEQFVKRASKHTLKWLQEFQRDTITIDEIRKKFIERCWPAAGARTATRRTSSRSAT